MNVLHVQDSHLAHIFCSSSERAQKVCQSVLGFVLHQLCHFIRSPRSQDTLKLVKKKKILPREKEMRFACVLGDGQRNEANGNDKNETKTLSLIRLSVQRALFIETTLPSYEFNGKGLCICFILVVTATGFLNANILPAKWKGHLRLLNSNCGVHNTNRWMNFKFPFLLSLLPLFRLVFHSLTQSEKKISFNHCEANASTKRMR